MRHLKFFHPVTFVLALTISAIVITACDQSTPISKSEEDTAPTQVRSSVELDNAASKTVYRAKLTPLNRSGVQGKALFTVGNGQFTALVNAVGHVPNNIHAQHIHVKLDNGGAVSTCPTVEDDANGDGILQVGEGVPNYGGIEVPLAGSLNAAEGLGDPATFPTATNEGGAISYRETVAVGDLAVNSGGGFDALTLDDHAVVLHADFVDGQYNITLPGACGTIDRVNER